MTGLSTSSTATFAPSDVRVVASAQLVAVFGVGYADLGLVVSVTYVVSGLMQTPAGILVDRLGPSRVLIGGLGIYSASALLSGLAPTIGFVYPDLDLGAAVTPYFIGQLLDRGMPRFVFVVAGALIVAIASAVVVTKPSARRKQPA